MGSCATPDTDTWARRAFARLSRLAGVHRVGLALTEGGGRRLLFAASDRDNEPDVDWCWIDAYLDLPLTTVVRHGRQVTGSLDEIARHFPEFASRQHGSTGAVAAVPLCAAGQVLGGFVLFYDRSPAFDHAECEHLHVLGERLGTALRRTQHLRGHRVGSLAAEPVPDGARVATYEVPADPRGVGAARHFMHDMLIGWDVDDDTVDVAVLCLSEVVTNAVMHTNGGCELRVVLDDGVLSTAVRDTGPATAAPSEPAIEPLAVHGRGLHLVDALTSRWGSDLDPSGMTVWFVLEPG